MGKTGLVSDSGAGIWMEDRMVVERHDGRQGPMELDWDGVDAAFSKTLPACSGAPRRTIDQSRQNTEAGHQTGERQDPSGIPSGDETNVDGEKFWQDMRQEGGKQFRLEVLDWNDDDAAFSEALPARSGALRRIFTQGMTDPVVEQQAKELCRTSGTVVCWVTLPKLVEAATDGRWGGLNTSAQQSGANETIESTEQQLNRAQECQSPTCTNGVLPRCPLCGRRREEENQAAGTSGLADRSHGATNAREQDGEMEEEEWNEEAEEQIGNETADKDDPESQHVENDEQENRDEDADDNDGNKKAEQAWDTTHPQVFMPASAGGWTSSTGNLGDIGGTAYLWWPTSTESQWATLQTTLGDWEGDDANSTAAASTRTTVFFNTETQMEVATTAREWEHDNGEMPYEAWNGEVNYETDDEENWRTRQEMIAHELRQRREGDRRRQGSEENQRAREHETVASVALHLVNEDQERGCDDTTGKESAQDEDQDTTGEGAPPCKVCLQPLGQGNELIALPCMCVFHAECITKWAMECNLPMQECCPQHVAHSDVACQGCCPVEIGQHTLCPEI